MTDDVIKEFLKKIASKGGKNRAKVLTAEQRRAIAKKASDAAAKVRSAKAKAKRRKP